MFERRIFALPDYKEVAVRLVEAVSSDWSWLDGSLDAPQSLKDSGQVAVETGYAISRFHTIKPTIVASPSPPDLEGTPDLYGLIADRRFPDFVRFDEAGIYKPISLDEAKRIAIAYVRFGYLGFLFFYSNYHDNSKYHNAARCRIYLQTPMDSIDGIIYPQDMPLSAVTLEWDEEYDGKEEDLEPILSVCRSLDLPELTPQAAR